MGNFRQFSKTISNETTPPTGPPESSSEVVFNPESTVLLAQQKGGAKPGYFVAYTVENGQVSEEPVITQITDIPLPFGSVFLDNNRLWVSDPTFGAAIVEVSSDGKVTELVHDVIPTQKAICWAEYDAALDTAYAPDAGQPIVYTFDGTSGAATGNFTAESTLR